jgi:putative serine protease PepD
MTMTDLFWPPAPTEELEPHQPEAPMQPVDRPRGWRTTAAAAGLSALVFGGVGVGVGAALDHGDTSPTAVLPATNLPSGSLSVVPTSYAGIAAKVLPSVVSINVATASGGDTGSGVILRSDGYILTNNHVIAGAVDGAGRVAVTFNDGSTAPARIVGADAQDDLAVIKVDRTGLAAATLGTATALHVGDAVIAVGSPLGLQGTVTAGIVSALNRPVDTSNSEQSNPFGGATPVTTVLDAIQIDAPINPGNSGGPLVNAAGQVVGINSAIASTGSNGSIGVGFAIPIDQAKVIASALITTGKADHPLLGVALADATDSGGNPLARVQSLSAGGAAAKAGLHVGDVIVAVGDQKTAGAEAVIAAVRTHQPGERVSVTVLRNGERTMFTVALANASDSQG